jgi:hypothetical protein
VHKGAQHVVITTGIRTSALEEDCGAKACANQLNAAQSRAAEQPPHWERRKHSDGRQRRDKAGHEQMRQQQEKTQQHQQQV